jgi:hypothetical protein
MFTGAGSIHRQGTRIEPPDEVLGGLDLGGNIGVMSRMRT